VVSPRARSTILRRFTGRVADELAILCRPAGGSPDAGQQAEDAYGELAAILASDRATFRHLAGETLFFRDIQRDLPLVLAARARVLANIGQSESASALYPTAIQQAPLDQGTAFELAAAAVLPHERDAWSVRDIPAAPSCGCEGCTRSGARILRLGEQTSLHTTNLYGTGSTAFAQASNMFDAAERLLNQYGMGFRDVVRTWIHLRDIDRDYDALNRARRAFFQRCGIEQRPASTGVQGGPYPRAHDVSMHLHAVKSASGLEITRMSTPTLNEAWNYGADFSRGLRIAELNKTALYISGTASIDETGQTAHPGNFAAQVDRMLHNLASLLTQQGASFENLVSGVAYLKHPSDASVFRSLIQERGFAGFPCALVEAPLCRPELLCEAEVLAMLPLATAGA